MPPKHELEIEITPVGQIKVHTKGAKGKKCLQYVEVFKSVGKVTDQQPTSEMYEPESTVSVADETRTRTTK